jgi:type II secretory pathway pseudopilin PulG
MTHMTPDTSTRQHQGIGLIEAVVVVSIISVAFVAILSAAVFFLRAGLTSAERVQAMTLLEEGVEAVRFLRDQGYAVHITPRIDAGVFYVEPTAGGVAATTTNTLIFGEFTRTVELETVYRNNSDDIVPSTAAGWKAVDPGTAELTVRVTWPGGSVDTVTYIADIYEN